MLRTGSFRTPHDAAMPFEPRLVAHEDDGRDRPVSRARLEVDEFAAPDLEALAVQLSDDAEYLAKLYPPRVHPAQLFERRPGWRAWMTRWRAAAAVLWFAGAAAAWSAWGMANRDESNQLASFSGSSAQAAHAIAVPMTRSALAAAADSVSQAGEVSRVDLPPAPRRVVRDANSNQIVVESDFSDLEPGDLLQDLSIPEQEAVFDLLESEPIELARVSL